MHRLAALVTVVLLAVGVAGLAGCGADQRVAVGSTATVPTTTPPRPTVPPTQARGSTFTSTARTSVPTTAARATTTTTTTKPKPKPPDLAEAGQGARVVAVFVATGPGLDAPSFATAKARLATLGYRGFSGGDTACSKGAREALPQLQAYSLSLPFATQADAARFVSLYGRVVGTAAVTVFCAD